MPKTVEFEKEISDQIVALREEGLKWSEISDQVDVPVGKCMLIFDYATVRPKDRVKDATGQDIVNLRDGENLSWAIIAARTGYPHTACRKLYEDETGKSTLGNRIGKGGRYPGGSSNGEKKPAAKKVAAKAKSEPGKLDGLSNEEVKERILGRMIKVVTDDGEDSIRVKAVKRVSKGTVQIADENDQGRTVKRAAVVAISKNKVIKGV